MIKKSVSFGSIALAVLALAVVLRAGTLPGMEADACWWPGQSLPAAIVRSTPSAEWKPQKAANAYRMLLQSVSGLAAKAVNEKRGDELVWIATGGEENEEWGRRFLAAHPRITVRDTLSPWALVERYAKQGIIKGYILYRFDTSQAAEGSKTRPGIDYSSNVATSLAGILHAVMVDESLEAGAKKLGLPMFLDARDKTQLWCFETHREKFSRKMLLAMDPKMTSPRDYAIAHNAFAVFGYDEPLESALKWIEPPAPVLGWIGGDEFKATRFASVHGHFQTATSLCNNLPVLMAGAGDAAPPRVPRFDPGKIDWNDKRSTVSFLTSDGDNVLFTSNSLLRTSPHFWETPSRGRAPFGWTMPLAHLVQLIPQAIEYAVETRTPNDWFVEWHGGYYYPDLFAMERPDRWQILAQHARNTWAMMRRAGAGIIGFNIRQFDSPDAQKALETFIGETDGLLAVLAFQYSPYNKGQGSVLWFKDRRGVEIPVITLRYQMWWNMNKRANAGTPAKLAREVRETVEKTKKSDLPRHDWGMVHVWSWFKEAPGADENAESLPAKKAMPAGVTYESLGGMRGYAPFVWFADRLPGDIRIISPDEMAWRIRMKHNPGQTRREIENYQERGSENPRF